MGFLAILLDKKKSQNASIDKKDTRLSKRIKRFLTCKKRMHNHFDLRPVFLFEMPKLFGRFTYATRSAYSISFCAIAFAMSMLMNWLANSGVVREIQSQTLLEHQKVDQVKNTCGRAVGQIRAGF